MNVACEFSFEWVMKMVIDPIAHGLNWAMMNLAKNTGFVYH
jgi:hypothetical protein